MIAGRTGHHDLIFGFRENAKNNLTQIGQAVAGQMQGATAEGREPAASCLISFTMSNNVRTL